ncbi:MAG: transcription termination factor Rho [Desulfobacteraceae bacterium]|nr:transcription termination factor Rho [Desulfobacteraceae bacterium]
MKAVQGYLEITDNGNGFLRSIDQNFGQSPSDIYVPENLLNRANLKEGLFIEGLGVEPKKPSGCLQLKTIGKANNLEFEKYTQITSLQHNVSIHPCERFVLGRSHKDITGRALDMICPIGRGQRGLIIAPPKSGKTTLLKFIANAVTSAYDDAKVFVLLVDERPEEVTDFKRGLKKAHVLSSSADQRVDQHMRIIRLAMNTAIRWTEMGHDAVVFIDSLTRMTRAFNRKIRSNGRVMTGGLGANAMELPRQIFGAARNLEGAGSLTIIATILVDTGSKMDEIIYQEFKGTGNMDLALSRKCAEQRLWPAIDIHNSGTRKEELLMSRQEYDKIVEFRRALAGMSEVKALTTFLEHLANKR